MTSARRRSVQVGPGTANSGVRARRPLQILLAGAAVLIVLAAIGLSLINQRGLASPEEVGTAYLTAVRAQDRAALERLTPSDFEVQAAIDEKLALYADAGSRRLEITYLPGTITPNLLTARIEGDGITDQISIQRFGSRWHLTIGYLRDQSPGPSPAQTR